MRRVRTDLWPGVEAGAIVPEIGAVRKLSDAISVHAEFANGALASGKTVFKVREEPDR